MDFVEFSSELPKIEKIPLPGLWRDHGLIPDPNHLRWAGVLCLFYPDCNGKTHFVLIRRQSDGGAHSGQIAFPGGRRDDQEVDLSLTALRECEEEIGVSRETIKLIKPMSELYIPPSDFWVQPFIGITHSTPEFTPQAEEVAGIIEVPAKDLFAELYLKMETIETPSLGSVKAPVFDFQGNRVWGATALMLYEMRQLMGQIIS